jgi:hypothetical protein
MMMDCDDLWMTCIPPGFLFVRLADPINLVKLFGVTAGVRLVNSPLARYNMSALKNDW